MLNINKHYNTLKVPNNSELADVKKAYKKLALKHHPDRGGDPKKFQEIASAYEEIEKYLTRPKQNRNIHIFEPNINDIFSNDLNTFNFVFNNNNRNTFYSQQQTTVTPCKQIKVTTKVINGKSQTIIEETDTRTGKTIIRNY
tara:strand:+ start:1678 stop:2103 length:426 start_codon:yes stop_codon:yes gene_type:complete